MQRFILEMWLIPRLTVLNIQMLSRIMVRQRVEGGGVRLGPYEE